MSDESRLGVEDMRAAEWLHSGRTGGTFGSVWHSVCMVVRACAKNRACRWVYLSSAPDATCRVESVVGRREAGGIPVDMQLPEADVGSICKRGTLRRLSYNLIDPQRCLKSWQGACLRVAGGAALERNFGVAQCMARKSMKNSLEQKAAWHRELTFASIWGLRAQAGFVAHFCKRSASSPGAALHGGAPCCL
eukprot:237911-Pelagomonas_calceolata.AAC.3